MILHKSLIDNIFPLKSTVAVILGNGNSLISSLFNVDFHFLQKNRSPVIFGVNRIFHSVYSDFKPVHYYLALDRTCWHNHSNEIRGMKCLKYFILDKFVRAADISALVQFNLGSNQFSFSSDASNPIGHFNTSIAPCAQLAVMQGAKEIHFFGVDCKPAENGLVHPHDIQVHERKEKTWNAMKIGITNLLVSLRKLEISYTIHSEYFDLEAKEYARNI